MNPLRCALEVFAGLISVKDVTSLDDILYRCKSHSKVCFFFFSWYQHAMVGQFLVLKA